jgi:hypothetical protein
VEQDAAAAAAASVWQEEKEAWDGERAALKAQVKALSVELKASLKREGEARALSEGRSTQLQEAATALLAQNALLERDVDALREQLATAQAAAATAAAPVATPPLPPTAEAEGRSTANFETQTSPLPVRSTVSTEQQCQTTEPPAAAAAAATAAAASDEQRRENDLLKKRISQLVSQEKDMFQSLSQRLQELDDARTKLLRLKTASAGANAAGAAGALGDGAALQMAALAARADRADADLQKLRLENQKLRLDVEKQKKHLALERKLSQSYLDDLARARHEAAAEVGATCIIHS